MQQKIVITGGPGTGKTTLLQSLKKRGFHCMDEISREIILKARENGIEHLFLKNPLVFSEILVKKRKEQFSDALKSTHDLIFFDRGIPDIEAYLNFKKQKHTFPFVEMNKTSTYDKIFITPPWQEIHTTDNERYETFSETKKIHTELENTYTKLGYKPISVPFGTPLQRIHFVLQQLHISQ
jgi:predicted ATPase